MPEKRTNFHKLSFKAPLPTVDGVSPSYVWLPEGTWITVLSFLRERFLNVPEETWLNRMHKGLVRNLSGMQISPDTLYRCGDCIFYYREPEPEVVIPFPEHILYQDDHILVADKPHFLPVIPSGRFLHETLLVRLKKRTGLDHLSPIHRIDRETAGIVVFSHNMRTRGAYQALMQQRAMHKVYEAIAEHLPSRAFPFTHRSCMVEGTPFFRMREVPGTPNSETRIDVLENSGRYSRYHLQPITGKKHQLRVHLSALGIPIVNDVFYPEALPCKGDDVSHPLQLLAQAISFRDPISGKERYFESQHKLQTLDMCSNRC